MAKEIPVFYTPKSFDHLPQYETEGPHKTKHQESSLRILQIMESLRLSGIADINVSTIDSVAWVEQVHDSKYLEYLKTTAHEAKQESIKKNNPTAAIYPAVFPYTEIDNVTNPFALRGKYMFDTFTPIMPNTYEVAMASAGAAIAGAELVASGEQYVYALTRPPGHHAEKSKMGGYCYVNNVAVAAEYLSRGRKNKIAIFDFDLHHGNGTQGIFYDRSDVLVVNIHADPKIKFPYYTGFKNETGKGNGEGYNFNYPLPKYTDDETYQPAVDLALKNIIDFSPDYLLISAGFDTHKRDPIGAFLLTTEYYNRLGSQIRALNLPTLTVQEGGYATKVLGENVVSYLKGLNGQK